MTGAMRTAQNQKQRRAALVWERGGAGRSGLKSVPTADVGRADGLEDGLGRQRGREHFFHDGFGESGQPPTGFFGSWTRSSGKQLGSGGANEEQILTGSQSLRSQPAFRNFGAGKQQQLGSDERMPEGELDWAE